MRQTGLVGSDSIHTKLQITVTGLEHGSISILSESSLAKILCASAVNRI